MLHVELKEHPLHETLSISMYFHKSRDQEQKRILQQIDLTKIT